MPLTGMQKISPNTLNIDKENPFVYLKQIASPQLKRRCRHNRFYTKILNLLKVTSFRIDNVEISSVLRYVRVCAYTCSMSMYLHPDNSFNFLSNFRAKKLLIHLTQYSNIVKCVYEQWVLREGIPCSQLLWAVSLTSYSDWTIIDCCVLHRFWCDAQWMASCDCQIPFYKFSFLLSLHPRGWECTTTTKGGASELR